MIHHRHKEQTPTLGPANALVTGDVFMDVYQYGTRSVYQRLQELAKRHPQRLRIRFHVVSYRRHSRWIAHAALEAHAQGRFHEFMTALINGRGTNIKRLPEVAKAAGIDLQAIQDAIKSQRHQKIFEENAAILLRSFGRSGSAYRPLVFINGVVPKRSSHRLALSDWETYYDEAYERAKQRIAAGIPRSELYCDAIRQLQTQRPVPNPRSGPVDGARVHSKTSPLMSAGLAALPVKTRRAKAPLVRLTLICNFFSSRCKRMNKQIDELRKLFAAEIEFAFAPYFETSRSRPSFPPIHEASLCAGEQNAFWSYYDATYRDMDHLGRSRALHRDRLESRAQQIGLDQQAFVSCLTSQRYTPVLNRSVQAIRKLGITGVPMILLGGRIYAGTHSRSELLQLILEQLRPGLLAQHSRCQDRPPY